jgi:hypothetical protein
MNEHVKLATCSRATTVNFGVRKGRIPEGDGARLLSFEIDEDQSRRGGRWFDFPRQCECRVRRAKCGRMGRVCGRRSI